MAGDALQSGERTRHWWRWFGVALFLLVPFDLLTTLLAVKKYGIGVEANPVMRWLLQHGLVAVGAVNLVVGCFVAYMFHVALRRFEYVDPTHRRAVTHLVDVWIGMLLVVGAAVATNNLLALV